MVKELQLQRAARQPVQQSQEEMQMQQLQAPPTLQTGSALQEQSMTQMGQASQIIEQQKHQLASQQLSMQAPPQQQAWGGAGGFFSDSSPFDLGGGLGYGPTMVVTEAGNLGMGTTNMGAAGSPATQFPQEQQPLSFLQRRISSSNSMLAPDRAQIGSAGAPQLQQVAMVLANALRNNPRNRQLNLLAVKVRSMMMGGMKKQDYRMIIMVIQKTIDIMGMEQSEDDRHKKWCTEELVKNKQETSMNEKSKEEIKNKIGSVEEQVKDVVKEMLELKSTVRKLIDSKNEATKARMEESKAASAEVTELQEAQQALYKAITVLQGVYGSALLQAHQPPRPTASELQQSATANGRVAPPPDTWVEGYEGKQQAGKNILQMLAEIGEDCVKQEAEVKKEEEEAKKAYEQTVKDVDEEVKAKQDVLVERSGLQARLELTQETLEGDLEGVEDALDELEKQALELHGSCDFMLKNYDERKKLRSAEVENMKKAIDILANA